MSDWFGDTLFLGLMIVGIAIWCSVPSWWIVGCFVLGAVANMVETRNLRSGKGE